MDCATTIEALLANLDADKTLEARLKYLFEDVVDFAKFLEESDESILLSIDILVDCFKEGRWTRFTRLRLEATWALRKTIGVMQAICDNFLAMEPFGSMLRAQEDIDGSSEQPMLQREDLIKQIRILAPNASESYLRSVDQKTLPELLKSLSVEGFPDFHEHLGVIIPGGRT